MDYLSDFPCEVLVYLSGEYLSVKFFDSLNRDLLIKDTSGSRPVLPPDPSDPVLISPRICGVGFISQEKEWLCQEKSSACSKGFIRIFLMKKGPKSKKIKGLKVFKDVISVYVFSV